MFFSGFRLRRLLALTTQRTFSSIKKNHFRNKFVTFYPLPSHTFIYIPLSLVLSTIIKSGVNPFCLGNWPIQFSFDVIGPIPSKRWECYSAVEYTIVIWSWRRRQESWSDAEETEETKGPVLGRSVWAPHVFICSGNTNRSSWWGKMSRKRHLDNSLLYGVNDLMYSLCSILTQSNTQKEEESVKS
jgi:hypothetical protein